MLHGIFRVPYNRIRFSELLPTKATGSHCVSMPQVLWVGRAVSVCETSAALPRGTFQNHRPAPIGAHFGRDFVRGCS